MIKAYFDESEQRDGTFCVAAFCYFPAKAKKLDKRWRQIMGGLTFHATDMNCGEGDFKGLDKTTSDEMYRSLIDAILKYAEFGVVLSVSTQDISVRWPGLDGIRNAYAFCCTLIVMGISYHIQQELGIKSRVAYVFEAGHRHQSEAERFMKSIADSSEDRKDFYRYLSHSFVGKGKETLLQTADFLAWEWCKYTSGLDKKLTMRPHKRPGNVLDGLRNARKSLQAILTRGEEKLVVGHLSKGDLESDLTNFQKVEEIICRMEDEQDKKNGKGGKKRMTTRRPAQRG